MILFLLLDNFDRPSIHWRFATAGCPPGYDRPSSCCYQLHNWIYNSVSCGTTSPRSVFLLACSTCSKSLNTDFHLHDFPRAMWTPDWCRPRDSDTSDFVSKITSRMLPSQPGVRKFSWIQCLKLWIQFSPLFGASVFLWSVKAPPFKHPGIEVIPNQDPSLTTKTTFSSAWNLRRKSGIISFNVR